MQTNNRISKIVRSKRLSFGLTQKKLAELLGYKQDDNNRIIYLIESGRMKVPKDKLKRLSKVLFIDRVSLAELLVLDYVKEVEKLLNVRLH